MLQRVLSGLGLVIALVAGLEMGALQSQAGNTVAEAFYHQIGWLGIGLAILLLAILVSLEAMRASRHPFVGAAGQCPTCRQVISQQAEVCPYCHVRLGR